MIRIYCDGCRKQISTHQAVESRVAEATALGMPFNHQMLLMEITQAVEFFCPECLEHASQWWTETRPQLRQELAIEAEGRFNNSRKAHFSSRGLKAVENKGTSRPGRAKTG